MGHHFFKTYSKFLVLNEKSCLFHSITDASKKGQVKLDVTLQRSSSVWNARQIMCAVWFVSLMYLGITVVKNVLCHSIFAFGGLSNCASMRCAVIYKPLLQIVEETGPFNNFLDDAQQHDGRYRLLLASHTKKELSVCVAE
jgi:hypothetical protein